MNKWVIGAGVVGGVGLLVWLAKKSADSIAAKSASVVSASTTPGATTAAIGPSVVPVTSVPLTTGPAIVPAVSPAAAATVIPANVEVVNAGTPTAAAQMYVPIYAFGQLTGQTMLWTSSPEQSKLVGPRYPSYYDLDYGRFVFDDASGGYTYVTLDPATNVVSSTGATTARPAA